MKHEEGEEKCEDRCEQEQANTASQEVEVARRGLAKLVNEKMLAETIKLTSLELYTLAQVISLIR